MLTVNVNSGMPVEEQRHIALKLVKEFPDQLHFATAFGLNNWGTDSWLPHTIAYLKASFDQGAIGVKIWKNIGMELKDANGKFIVSGRPGNCGSTDIKSNVLTPARTTLKDGFAPLLQLAQFRKQSGDSDGIKSLTLSLNPELQLLASNIGKCNDKNPSCNADLFNQLKLTSDLTFTILNANTGALLAVGCYGKSCSLTANYQLGLLAGANIEGPPASTEKLLFSYAFLKNLQLPARLINQAHYG
jgi:hypothetical protein